MQKRVLITFLALLVFGIALLVVQSYTERSEAVEQQQVEPVSALLHTCYWVSPSNNWHCVDRWAAGDTMVWECRQEGQLFFPTGDPSHPWGVDCCIWNQGCPSACWCANDRYDWCWTPECDGGGGGEGPPKE